MKSFAFIYRNFPVVQAECATAIKISTYYAISGEKMRWLTLNVKVKRWPWPKYIPVTWKTLWRQWRQSNIDLIKNCGISQKLPNNFQIRNFTRILCGRNSVSDESEFWIFGDRLGSLNLGCQFRLSKNGFTDTKNSEEPNFSQMIKSKNLHRTLENKIPWLSIGKLKNLKNWDSHSS